MGWCMHLKRYLEKCVSVSIWNLPPALKKSIGAPNRRCLRLIGPLGKCVRVPMDALWPSGALMGPPGNVLRPSGAPMGPPQECLCAVTAFPGNTLMVGIRRKNNWNIWEPAEFVVDGGGHCLAPFFARRLLGCGRWMSSTDSFCCECRALESLKMQAVDVVLLEMNLQIFHLVQYPVFLSSFFWSLFWSFFWSFFLSFYRSFFLSSTHPSLCLLPVFIPVFLPIFFLSFYTSFLPVFLPISLSLDRAERPTLRLQRMLRLLMDWGKWLDNNGQTGWHCDWWQTDNGPLTDTPHIFVYAILGGWIVALHCPSNPWSTKL